MRVGFVVENIDAYDRVMASTRLRCYDVMNFFNGHQHPAELFEPSRHYDVVIFQKCIKPEFRELAQRLKQQATKTILDINVNYIETDDKSPEFINETHRQNVSRMLQTVDHVLTSSPMLQKIYSSHHQSVFCIEEGIADCFFAANKISQDNTTVKLLYCGYSIKAKELHLIGEVLRQLHQTYGATLLLITEKDPGLSIIPYEFLQYQQSLLPQLLLQGDIKIAPRQTDCQYNLGHTFTKVGYPMAVGLPAVASPVPAYLNREVLLCAEEKEWYQTLERLITQPRLRAYYGQRGRQLVQNNFSAKQIGQQYLDFLAYIAQP